MDTTSKGKTPEQLARDLLAGAPEGVDALSDQRLRKCARFIPNGQFFRDMIAALDVSEDLRETVRVRLRRVLGSKVA